MLETYQQLSTTILPQLEVRIVFLHIIQYAQEQIFAHLEAMSKKTLIVRGARFEVVLLEKPCGSVPIPKNNCLAPFIKLLKLITCSTCFSISFWMLIIIIITSLFS